MRSILHTISVKHYHHNIDFINTNMPNQYKTNIYPDSLQGIADGISKATGVVKKTLGAKGTNVILEKELQPFHILTNDGATIIEAMEMEDPLEKRGLAFLKEVVARSNNNSGDGSTTTCILVDAILKEGIKTGVNTLEIKKSLDECLPLIEQKIDEQTKQITTDGIYDVAIVSGESSELAETLASIYKEIGKEGIIHLENSGTFETNFSTINGVRFTDTGYLSPYMVYEEDKRKKNEKETKAIYHNPTILVTKRKINHLNDINPLLETLQKKGKKDLVIFTNDMDSGVASLLIKAHRDRIINCLIIKAPTLWKDYVFEDFAKITGATIVEDSSGITSWKDLPLSALGTCGKIVVDKEETVVTGLADISDHIEALKQDGSTDSLRRLSWLQTKTAILKLGANSETELSWKRLKCEDAINSCQKALQSGVVIGGGLCLELVSHELPDTIGGKILSQALLAPCKQILENMNLGEPNWGIEIIDAAKVVKQAIRNAIGVSSTILTASAVITLPKKDQAQAFHELLQNKPISF